MIMISLGFLVGRPKDLLSSSETLTKPWFWIWHCFSVFDTLQSKLLKCLLYLSNQSGWNLKVALRFPVSQVWSGHLELRWCSLVLFIPHCCSLIFLLCALDSTAGFLPSVPRRGVLACVWAWIPAHIVILGLRVVKLAETDAAACCFPWLQHSSPDEGWVRAKPAVLLCGPDFLFVSLLPSFLCWDTPATFPSYPSVFLCPCR